ncbi:MAG: FMN-binding protein, partial [Desulfobacterales bacterium]|nr:FMN-binding protein [Desulfobacterales bacterium]
MSSQAKSLLFAAVLCLVCSIVLTAAATGLQALQQKNVLHDKHRNILKSVALIDPNGRYDRGAVEKLYDEFIAAVWVTPEGEIVAESDRGQQDYPIYLYTRENAIQAYIVPIDSRGLWGRILGYLAIESDGSTISGFTVYQHSETPGLGGEIEKKWFQKNFVGKRIVDRDGDFVSVQIAKGDVETRVPEPQQPHYVDG